MASNAATARSSPRNTTPTSIRVPQLEPGFAYEGLADPLQYNLALGERVIPIPQGSPSPVNVPTTVYYRDIITIQTFPAFYDLPLRVVRISNAGHRNV